MSFLILLTMYLLVARYAAQKRIFILIAILWVASLGLDVTSSLMPTSETGQAHSWDRLLAIFYGITFVWLGLFATPNFTRWWPQRNNITALANNTTQKASWKWRRPLTVDEKYILYVGTFAFIFSSLQPIIGLGWLVSSIIALLSSLLLILVIKSPTKYLIPAAAIFLGSIAYSVVGIAIHNHASFATLITILLLAIGIAWILIKPNLACFIYFVAFTILYLAFILLLSIGVHTNRAIIGDYAYHQFLSSALASSLWNIIGLGFVWLGLRQINPAQISIEN